VHGGNADATCMSAQCFAKRTQNHAFMCLVTCWIPEPWKWKCNSQVSTVAPKLDRALLLHAVHEEATRDWGVALKKAQKKDYQGAKKVIVHALRMLRIATEYAQTGKTPNLWCVGDLVTRTASSWGDVNIEDEFGAEFEEAISSLQRVCNSDNHQVCCFRE
jgi:hypothetical protein